ncbi:voltage-gated chloride channel protein (ClC-type) [Legionella geestiana]|uniref:Voltage-gated chloride channel protein (ClC-type) n=1 Tax=Legionella geestiana TaxID=45065 RepID=A0A0W0TRY2_9GAMM|nr:H(+)/Cl(-) exchange transporter ClcA [Legionella geestiana]KTC98326.1 voltage-gated chloride channel protein (ClC-type) [Legionella geestiana]QBS11372.1 H(+)/Cl(-) exchange transporter ClcA [Legionella geestiana]STX53973.1 voltage-gated chloride channel protein (ClC-type) [Legionella geestiana]
MREKLLSVYGMSILLGVLTGLAGSGFEAAIAASIHLIDALFQVLKAHGIAVLPVSAFLSMLLTVGAFLLVSHFAPEAAGSGVQEIEGSLLHLRPLRWMRVLPVKFVGGVLAISARLVLGREGPTIQMGGALGAFISDAWRLSPLRRDGFVAAGAAAGLATAFNAPLAGILFVIEEMRNQFDYSFTHFKMVAITCVAATLTNNFLLGSGPAISMPVFAQNDFPALGLFFLFGILAGFVALGFNHGLMGLLQRMDCLGKRGRLVFAATVGLIAGLLAPLVPDAVGGGYTLIEETLGVTLSLQVLLMLFAVRFAMTLLSYGTGVPGGVFAPLLALGTLLGVMASLVFGWLFPGIVMHPGIFAVCGMAALFSACVRAPITGIVLVVEMTWNYALIFPLLIVCLTSTTIMQLAKNGPLYTQLLRRTLKKGP